MIGVLKHLPVFSCRFVERTEFTLSHVTDLERWIDQLTQELPPLTNFILPVTSSLHIKQAVNTQLVYKALVSFCFSLVGRAVPRCTFVGPCVVEPNAGNSLQLFQDSLRSENESLKKSLP